MRRQSVIREDICFAAIEVAVIAPRFRRGFFNSPPRGSERTRPGRNLSPNLARCRLELLTGLETAYAVRKEIG